MDSEEADGRKALQEGSFSEALRVFLRYPTPWIIALAVVVGWSGRIWLGNWTWWDGLVAGVILGFWPMQEWLIHVLVLHFKPFEIFGRRIDLHVAKKHRAHHNEPWRIADVFIPTRTLLVSLPTATAVWFLVAPTWELAFGGLAFYSTMTLVYEWVHFLVHTNYRPKTPILKRLRKNHRLHHFKHEQNWFGVTMLSGDRIMGTAPAPNEVETSETVDTLGVEE